MKRIYLIDCPGVVPPNQGDSPEDILLRGVVRVENVENPEQYIAAVLKKTKPQHIERTYGVKEFSTPTEFLEILARKGGRLLKGGEADVDGVAKMVLNDFLRGKIPWFTPPPILDGEQEPAIAGRKGMLGEMGPVQIPTKDGEHADGRLEEVAGDKDEEDDFEGFEEGRDTSDEEMSDADEDVSADEGPPIGGVLLDEEPELVSEA